MKVKMEMPDWFRELVDRWRAEKFDMCKMCGSLVPLEGAAIHVEWHETQDAIIDGVVNAMEAMHRLQNAHDKSIPILGRERIGQNANVHD